MRTLEFQEALRGRNELIRRLESFECTLCEDFEDHASPNNHFISDQTIDKLDSISTSMVIKFCGQR